MAHQIIHVRQKYITESRKLTSPSPTGVLSSTVPGKNSCSLCPIALAIHCPIALAIHDQTEHKDTVVFETDIYTHEPCRKAAHVPRSVKRFIKKFDRGEKVKPFRFILRWV